MEFEVTISKLISRLKAAEAEFNKPLSKRDKMDFELEYNVFLPESLSNFLTESNGIDCPSEMVRFWQLNEYQNLHNSYELDQQYLIRKEFETNDSLIWELDENLNSKTWLLEDVKSQFIFCDYNFEGTFWSINLDKNSGFYERIIMLSFHTNNYRIAAQNFEEFLKIYDEGEIEHLL